MVGAVVWGCMVSFGMVVVLEKGGFFEIEYFFDMVSCSWEVVLGFAVRAV